MFESHYGIEKMAFEYCKDFRRCRKPLGHESRKIVRRSMFSIICLLLLLSCTVTPLMQSSIDNSRLNDGVYQGFYEGGLNSALVEIAIDNQKIINLTILEHDTLLGKKAEAVIISEILEKQTTEVDVVSGATNSSRVILNAAKIALEQACKVEM